MSDWTPPKFGSPCWVGIPANDVARASRFYETVFNFSFKKDKQSASYPQDKLMMFDFKPDVNLSGGIQKVPEPTGVMKPGPGGVCMYWLVEDVNKTGEIIEKAGGKMLCGVEKEGDFGLYRFFEDTEGTVGAVYQMANALEP